MSDVSRSITPAQKTAIENATAHEAAAAPHNGHALPFTTQNDVIGSRAVNVVYQNTTGKLMLVMVTMYVSTASQHVEIRSDSNATPSDVVCKTGMTATKRVILPCFVLSGNYYVLVPDSGNSVLEKWVEVY